MQAKRYVGEPNDRDWKVFVTESNDGAISSRPLNPRHDIRNHSPDGFAWGYGGSGPAQLALALLCDAIGVERAEKLYQQFKFSVIARLPQDAGWTFTVEQVRAKADELQLEMEAARHE